MGQIQAVKAQVNIVGSGMLIKQIVILEDITEAPVALVFKLGGAAALHRHAARGQNTVVKIVQATDGI